MKMLVTCCFQVEVCGFGLVQAASLWKIVAGIKRRLFQSFCNITLSPGQTLKPKEVQYMQNFLVPGFSNGGLGPFVAQIGQ